MTEPLIQSYPDKGVNVTVGWQGFKVQVLRIPSPALAELHSPADEFKPRRALVNVVVARDDNIDLLVTQYDPPLEIQIAYTAEDLTLAQAAKLDHPQVGFWDGQKWVLFQEKKHDLKYVAVTPAMSERTSSEIIGYAVVNLREWADPLIGMGPP